MLRLTGIVQISAHKARLPCRVTKGDCLAQSLFSCALGMFIRARTQNSSWAVHFLFALLLPDSL